jgi:hypothetical protein
VGTIQARTCLKHLKALDMVLDPRQPAAAACSSRTASRTPARRQLLGNATTEASENVAGVVDVI